MKEIYIVREYCAEYHYGDIHEHTDVVGVFENIEDAKAYIKSRRCPSNYQLVDWIDYYESGAKERFGW